MVLICGVVRLVPFDVSLLNTKLCKLIKKKILWTMDIHNILFCCWDYSLDKFIVVEQAYKEYEHL